MITQDLDMTGVLVKDVRDLHQIVKPMTGKDAFIGPIETSRPSGCPEVMAVLVWQLTSLSTGVGKIVGDERHGTPEPAPNVATSTYTPERYWLLAVQPGQRCWIEGILFFRETGAVVTTSSAPESSTATLAGPEPPVTTPSAPEPPPKPKPPPRPKLSTLEPTVTLTPPIPSFPMWPA